MDAKHTPGPWAVGSANIGSHPIGIHSGGMYGYVLADVHCDVPEVARHCSANARLIAAAPELLAVVQELEDSASYWSEYDVPLGIVDRLRAAIALATGAA